MCPNRKIASASTPPSQPITASPSPAGSIRGSFQIKRSDSYEYASGYFTHAYPPVDPKNPAYRLTVREGFASAPRADPARGLAVRPNGERPVSSIRTG